MTHARINILSIWEVRTLYSFYTICILYQFLYMRVLIIYYKTNSEKMQGEYLNCFIFTCENKILVIDKNSYKIKLDKLYSIE